MRAVRIGETAKKVSDQNSTVEIRAMAWTTSITEPPYMDPASIASEFIKQAVANMLEQRQIDIQEAEADERELERRRLSAAAKKSWATRRAQEQAKARPVEPETGDE